MTDERPNILIVDDTPANLNVLSAILRKQDYRVRAAPNGQGGLKTALKSPPDLILLDIQMPDMDGYSVCKELKSNAETRYIPVIFISALDDGFDKVQAFEAGGIDYISKPFQIEEVLVRIETHLTIAQQQKRLLEIQDTARTLAEQANQLENLINSGNSSDQTLEIAQNIQQLADSLATAAMIDENG